jgi:hypothetical protein
MHVGGGIRGLIEWVGEAKQSGPAFSPGRFFV